MLVKEFKRDYLSYFSGIIIPALVSFFTIPLFKNILGASKFGVYTYYASILIIINATFSGGISQSIMRLQIDYEDKSAFFYQSLALTSLISFLISIPLFVYVQLNYGAIAFSCLFIVACFLANFYTSFLAITQSRLLSVTSALSESFRTLSFMGIAFALLTWFPAMHFLLVMFFSMATSYGMGCVFLYFRNNLSLENVTIRFGAIVKIGKEFSRYGGYLMGWFFFTYCITMSNRFVLAQRFGKENIGHFTASFDILNKSIIFLLSPVLIALFPLVIKAFSEQKHAEVSLLIKRLILLEAAMMAAGLIAFSFFGFSLLSKLLNTPATHEYLLIDLQVICSTFIWQMAMLQHKYLELNKRTGKMLLFIFIAFAVSITTDVLLITNGGLQYAGVGFLAGGITYLLLVAGYSKKVLSPLSNINR